MESEQEGRNNTWRIKCNKSNLSYHKKKCQEEKIRKKKSFIFNKRKNTNSYSPNKLLSETTQTIEIFPEVRRNIFKSNCKNIKIRIQ